MRDRIADLSDRLKRRNEAATLSEPVSYGDLVRFLFWRGGYALAGPLVILLAQPLLSGLTGTILLGGGMFALAIAAFAGGARALDRPVQATALGTLTACALVVLVLRSTTDDALSTAFAAGMTALFGLASALVGPATYDAVERELRGTA
jgi:hypothetical protein